MERYSVAIRTLGLNPALLRQELESIYAQSIPPEKVVIYIARGYEVPGFRVGTEQYVPCDKGMVRQRAMDYAEIDTPLLLLLDDDVLLAPDTVERLARALDDGGYDCVSADVFACHRMGLGGKVYAALSNLTFPHLRQRWACKIHSNGSFSYLNQPRRDAYPSQTAAGPCSLWRAEWLRRLRFADEVWLDEIGFAYNDDGLEFYKLHVNGGRLAVHYDSGAVHVSGRTASDIYHRRADAFRLRAKATYMVWHRMLCRPDRPVARRLLCGASFWLKAVLIVPAHLVAAVRHRRLSIPWQYIQGLAQGVRACRALSHLPPYKLAGIESNGTENDKI